MRIALIADIHGNATGLDAVLVEIDRLGADEIVCLGDVAVLGPKPKAVISRLRDLGSVVVRGNSDAWLVDEPSGAEQASLGPVADLRDWTLSQLDNTDLATIRGYPRHHTVTFADGSALICAHGSPRSFEDVIGPSTPVAAIAEMFTGHTAAFAAGGQTHVQLYRRFADLGFINPGSAGLPGAGPNTPDLPGNRNVTWVEFAILNISVRTVSVDLRRVSIDLEGMLDAARATSMPHFDWWRARWGGHSRT